MDVVNIAQEKLADTVNVEITHSYEQHDSNQVQSSHNESFKRCEHAQVSVLGSYSGVHVSDIAQEKLGLTRWKRSG